LMVNLIEGTDGRKMSSSWGNTINIMDELNDMFGKVMSMPDDLIIKYFVHCTRIPMEMVAQKEAEMKSNALNPRDAKMELAFEITKIYHGEAKAQEAKEYFVNTFSEKKTPENISEIKIEKDEIKLSEFLVLAKVADSISDARRKIEQGGVEINGEKISDYKIVLNKDNSGNIIKSGKINFIKIVF